MCGDSWWASTLQSDAESGEWGWAVGTWVSAEWLRRWLIGYCLGRQPPPTRRRLTTSTGAYLVTRRRASCDAVAVRKDFICWGRTCPLLAIMRCPYATSHGKAPTTVWCIAWLCISNVVDRFYTCICKLQYRENECEFAEFVCVTYAQEFRHFIQQLIRCHETPNHIHLAHRTASRRARRVTGCFAPSSVLPFTYSTFPAYFPAYSVKTQVPSSGCFNYILARCTRCGVSWHPINREWPIQGLAPISDIGRCQSYICHVSTASTA